jgi:dCMP deaminase
MEKPTTEISNLSSKFSSFDTTFLKVAEVIAERSKSTRLKVGAVLVKDKRIISTGYNGLVSGVEPDVLEDENGVTKKEVIHAELNCIISCARNGISCEGATLYLTHSPCESCAALIAQSGIKKVIFKEYYRDLSGIEKLKSYGVKVI